MEKQPLTNTETDSTAVGTFTVENVDHDLVKKYQPRFIAKGGEQIVYEVPEHPDVVAKVATEPLKQIISWNMNHGEPASSLSEEIEERSKKFLKEESERYQQLKKYFGAEHIPKQKQYLVQVPVTQEILNALYDNNPPVAINEAWSVMTIQERVNELTDPSRLALVGGYAEKNELPGDVYNRVTRHLIFGHNPEEKLTQAEFLQVQWNDDIKILMEKTENNESLKISLRELVEDIILYTSETGEILDLAGHDNIILYPKGEKWSYSLVDAKYPGNSKMIDTTKFILEKLSNKTEIEEYEKSTLLNIFNYIRTINGIAERLGSRSRISIPIKDTNLEEVNFQTILGHYIRGKN